MTTDDNLKADCLKESGYEDVLVGEVGDSDSGAGLGRDHSDLL